MHCFLCTIVGLCWALWLKVIICSTKVRLWGCVYLCTVGNFIIQSSSIVVWLYVVIWLEFDVLLFFKLIIFDCGCRLCLSESLWTFKMCMYYVCVFFFFLGWTYMKLCMASVLLLYVSSCGCDKNYCVF